MYKCSECEKEYDIKPAYCDCGNDVFIEIASTPQIQPKEKIQKKSFEEQYPEFSKFKKSLDPISVIIFCICIILSILSLIFIGRGENIVQEEKEEVIAAKKVNTNIESFWDNSLPKKEEVIVVKEEVQTPAPIMPAPKVETPKKATPKLQQEIQVKPKTQTQKTTSTKQTQTKPQQVKQTKTQQTAQTKPAQSSQTKTQQTVQVKTQQTTQNQNIHVSSQSTQTNTQTPKINIQTTPQTTVKTPKKPTQAELQELRNYKNSLRNLIFSYIDFTSIVGDGICVITFTVNESGQLKNKVFAQKSASMMLNDAVFYAMKKVTTFKQPPSAYRGETLKFTVQFVSGQYEVSLN